MSLWEGFCRSRGTVCRMDPLFFRPGGHGFRRTFPQAGSFYNFSLSNIGILQFSSTDPNFPQSFQHLVENSSVSLCRSLCHGYQTDDILTTNQRQNSLFPDDFTAISRLFFASKSSRRVFPLLFHRVLENTVEKHFEIRYPGFRRTWRSPR